ncbi:hypothetical protein [Sorangium sp. So ce117]|uniref:hypothetical protein n=1 Tax=Sorangium sp. So ce117 TaxID=3133277 RepID=UPI003F614DD5
MAAEVAIAHLRLRLRGLRGSPASADSFVRAVLAALERELETVLPATGEVILLPRVTLDLRVVVPPGASSVDAIARAMAAQLTQIAATAPAVRGGRALPPAAVAPELTPARAHLLEVAAQGARAGRSGQEIAGLLAAGAAAEAGTPRADAPDALVALALTGTCSLALLGRLARRRLLHRMIAALDDASARRVLARLDDELAAAAPIASPEPGRAEPESGAPSLPSAADLGWAVARIAAAGERGAFALPAGAFALPAAGEDATASSRRLVLAIAELARVTPAAVLRSTALRAALREALGRLLAFAAGSPRAPEELPMGRERGAPPPESARRTGSARGTESAHGGDTPESASRTGSVRGTESAHGGDTPESARRTGSVRGTESAHGGDAPESARRTGSARGTEGAHGGDTPESARRTGSARGTEGAHGGDTPDAAGGVAATAASIDPEPAGFEATAVQDRCGLALVSSGDAGTVGAGELAVAHQRGDPALVAAALTAAHPIALLGRLCRRRLLPVLLAELDPAIALIGEAPAAPPAPVSRFAPPFAFATDRGRALLARIGDELSVPSPRPLPGHTVSAAAAFELAAAEARALRSITPGVDRNVVPPHLRLLLAVAELARVTPAALVGSISLRAAVLEALERLGVGVRAVPAAAATSSWQPLPGDNLDLQPSLPDQAEPVAHLGLAKSAPKGVVFVENVSAPPSGVGVSAPPSGVGVSAPPSGVGVSAPPSGVGVSPRSEPVEPPEGALPAALTAAERDAPAGSLARRAATQEASGLARTRSFATLPSPVTPSWSPPPVEDPAPTITAPESATIAAMVVTPVATRDHLTSPEHPLRSAPPSAVDLFTDDLTLRSAAAGLAFLVRPVLELGWPDRLAAIHPEPSLALYAIFRRILAVSLGEDAADDPAAWLIAGLLDAPSLEERNADALTFAEGHRAGLAEAIGAEATTFAEVVDAWARAILDEARLRLAGTTGAEDLARDVLALGGVLACCETHLEVRLPFPASYEALLRAGLSLDIADVAWLDDRPLRFIFCESEAE